MSIVLIAAAAGIDGNIGRFQDSISDGAARISTAKEIHQTTIEAQADILRMLALVHMKDAPALIDKFQASGAERLEKVSASLVLMQKAAKNDAGTAKVLAELSASFEKLRTLLINSAKSARANPELGSPFVMNALQQYDDLLQRVRSMVEIQERRAAETSAALSTGIARLKLTLGSMFLLVSITTLAFMLWITKAIAQPIRSTAGVMTKLAQGDLDVMLPNADRRDEIGAIAGALAVFKASLVSNRDMRTARDREAEERQQSLARLNEAITTFKLASRDSLEELSQATRSVDAQAEHILGAIGQSNSQIHEVASSSSLSATNAQAISAAAEELARSIQQVSYQVHLASDTTNEAVLRAESTTASARELADAAKRIEDVIQLISTIAAQTNLLALNATIEAARAGEAGRGFSVVATEVKNLSNRTAEAVQEVTQHVQEFQQTSDAVIRAIGAIVKVVETVQSATANISDAISRQEQATSEISRNASASADATSKVSEGVEVVRNTSAEVVGIANETRTKVTGMRQQFETVRQQIAAFISAVQAQ